MSILKFIIFLMVSFYWAIFCIYNTGMVTVHVPGLKDVRISLSLFVLIIFLCGVFVTALLALIDQFHQWSQIKKLKKKVSDFDKNQAHPNELFEDNIESKEKTT